MSSTSSIVGIATAQRPLLGRLLGSRFLRNAGTMSSGTAIGHAFTLLAAPLLTRMFAPADFGAFGLFTSFVSVAGTALTLQYELSITGAATEKDAACLTLGSLALTVPTALASSLVLWWMIAHDSVSFGHLPLAAAPIMAMSLLFVGTFNALRYWNLREAKFASIAAANVTQNIVRAVLQVFCGIIGWKSYGLIAGDTLGRAGGVQRLFRNAWRRHAEYLPIRWRDVAATMARHRKFPLYSFPSSFMDAVFVALPLPLLVRQYGVNLGGQYSLVWKVIALPAVLVTAAVADTFHARLADCTRSRPHEVRHVFNRVALGLLAGGIVPALTLWLFGPQLFRLAFGARWIEAGALASLIAPWFLCQFIVVPLSRTVLVLSGQESKLIWDIFCIAGLLAVFAAAAHWHWPAHQTVRSLALCFTLCYAIYFLLLLRLVHRHRIAIVTAD